ncbi:hypothetical protein HYH03_004111 [Edaphochlamys debaryana]|uniref:tRNA-binding domain-containing protein n=1 Tax=Edaphochlamys debaryana TaxID=47281 RepID=A0A836C3M9_9CHLO|nr:hypothetical protein HYH03_004111 [Edaphochlamys debaryana]|eukprot:KAG2497844.1 hypothetical protein HYH03_004111 [Edaphochlamys debaryana]
MAAVELLDKAISLLDGLLAGAKPSAAAFAPAPAPAAAEKGAATPAPAPAAKAEKAPKPAKPAPAAPAASTSGASEDETLFARALIKVARVTSCEPLANSEKLLLLQIDIGNGETRQVCAGLQQFIKAEQLRGSLVCVVANLKAAKLAGQASEAMVLAADAGTGDSLIVRTLIPPAGAAPGDVVFLSGGAPTAAPDKVLKSDHWKKIGAGLKVVGGAASFNGRALVTAGGNVTLPSEIPEGAEIH